jgi:hypothetical protein
VRRRISTSFPALLDRLIVVAGDQDDLLRPDPLQPVLELASEERLLADEVALEGVRHVAGDEQQVACRNLDEVLVQVGDAMAGRAEALVGDPQDVAQRAWALVQESSTRYEFEGLTVARARRQASAANDGSGLPNLYGRACRKCLPSLGVLAL